MLHDAADVVEGHLGEAAVTIAGEEVDTVFPQGLVAVHPGAVVAVERLRHEGDAFAVAESDVADDVLEPLQGVTHGKQGVEAHVDFTLTAGGDFVVRGFDAHADALQHLHHLVAQVDQRVGGRDGEIAALVRRFVAEVGELLAARVPGPLDGVNQVEGLVVGGRITDLVEDEEFRLGSKVSGIGDAGRFQVGFCLAGDETRIASIAFLGDRVVDIADKAEGRDLGKRVDLGSGGVRHDGHVAVVDRLPATDRRPVKAETFFEDVLAEFADRGGKVLPDPDEIEKFVVHHLDLVFGCKSYDFMWGHYTVSFAGNGFPPAPGKNGLTIK